MTAATKITIAESTMITIPDLETKGYKKYPHSKGPFCVGLFQKPFLWGTEITYFLNVYMWSFPDAVGLPPRASTEVVLYRTDGVTHEGETAFHVNLMVGEHTTIDQIEVFYVDVYQKLGCVPDLHNN